MRCIRRGSLQRGCYGHQRPFAAEEDEDCVRFPDENELEFWDAERFFCQIYILDCRDGLKLCRSIFKSFEFERVFLPSSTQEEVRLVVCTALCVHVTPRRYLKTFPDWFNLYWMASTFSCLPMVKLALEKHSQWKALVNFGNR